jgi:hypothetical protein
MLLIKLGKSHFNLERHIKKLLYICIYTAIALYWVPQNSRNNSEGQCQLMLDNYGKNT